MALDPNKKTRPTLTQVARITGVSSATASLVLTGKAAERGIPLKTIERVQFAARELNYIPNLLLRSLRNGRSNVISFYDSYRARFSGDLYMDGLSSCIQQAGGENGYDVLFHCNFARSTREIYEFLSGGFADGLLFFAPQEDDPLIGMLRQGSLPVVIIGGSDAAGTFPSVRANNVEGMALVADALLSLGHKRVAALTVEENYRDAQVRVSLLQSMLAAGGGELPDHRVVAFAPDRPEVIAQLMSEPDPPTAIFCWHDRVAYWALDACKKLSIDVPADLSIIGFDGIHWPAQTAHVAASVVVDLNTLATRGIQVLDAYIAGYDGPLIEDTIPVTFSAGTSLSRPRTQ